MTTHLDSSQIQLRHQNHRGCHPRWLPHPLPDSTPQRNPPTMPYILVHPLRPPRHNPYKPELPTFTTSLRSIAYLYHNHGRRTRHIHSSNLPVQLHPPRHYHIRRPTRPSPPSPCSVSGLTVSQRLDLRETKTRRAIRPPPAVESDPAAPWPRSTTTAPRPARVCSTALLRRHCRLSI